MGVVTAKWEWSSTVKFFEPPFENSGHGPDGESKIIFLIHVAIALLTWGLGGVLICFGSVLIGLSGVLICLGGVLICLNEIQNSISNVLI